METLHSWNVDVEQARKIQETLRDRLILRKVFSKVRTIGGADAAYPKEGETVVGVIVILSFPTLERLDLAAAQGKATFPYLPGLLSFREGPVLIEAFTKVKVKPDVMIFEGQGIAHPRGFDLLPIWGYGLTLPSMGCTKTPLIRAPITVGTKKGDVQYLRNDDTEVGAVVRTKEHVKPVFVSPGHKIDLATSIQLIAATCRGYRMPEPLRQAISSPALCLNRRHEVRWHGFREAERTDDTDSACMFSSFRRCRKVDSECSESTLELSVTSV